MAHWFRLHHPIGQSRTLGTYKLILHLMCDLLGFPWQKMVGVIREVYWRRLFQRRTRSLVDSYPAPLLANHCSVFGTCSEPLSTSRRAKWTELLISILTIRPLVDMNTPLMYLGVLIIPCRALNQSENHDQHPVMTK